ncbi:MAG: cupin domain-containing protein [Actinobacteria bacterium]|nr:cupin domain-containing protein [Actinomycetota bacterium]
MGFDVVKTADLEWEEREDGRKMAVLSDRANMTNSRARFWRYPAHSKGRRHLDPDQEEVFVPIQGTLTMMLGEPPARFDIGPGEVGIVHLGTPMQLFNDTDDDVLFFAYGAPTDHGNAEFLDDAELV